MCEQIILYLTESKIFIFELFERHKMPTQVYVLIWSIHEPWKEIERKIVT